MVDGGGGGGGGGENGVLHSASTLSAVLSITSYYPYHTSCAFHDTGIAFFRSWTFRGSGAWGFKVVRKKV